MKTIEETKQWLLENRVDINGDLILSKLDFSDFNGNVYIDDLKVKKDLIQSWQQVQGNLFQGSQEVQGVLIQANQKVQGDLYQDKQKVQGDFLTQKLKDDEEYKINELGDNCIVKKAEKEE